MLGSEAVYCDAAGPLVPALALPDADLLARLHEAFPEAVLRPIGTSARVGGSHEIDVEAMEGFAVLRACELAGVPAVEVRVVSNEIDEPDRALWRFDDAFALLAETLPRLVAVASGRDEPAKQPLPPPLPPETRTVGQLVAETLKLYGDHLWTVACARDQPRADQPDANAVRDDRRPDRSCSAAGAPLMAASFAGASAIVGGVRPVRRDVARALVVGAIVFVPAAVFCAPGFVLPSVAWLALVGLVVPVLVLERPRRRRCASAGPSSWRAPTTSTRSARSRRS